MPVVHLSIINRLPRPWRRPAFLLTIMLGIAWLLPSTAAAEPIVRILRELHSRVRLVPGRGYGRSPEQCLEEGAGNALEITCAAMAELRRHGYSCELVAGQVTLSEAQVKAWSPLPWSARDDVFDGFLLAEEPNSPDMDLAWCQVLAPWLPGLGLNSINAPQECARQWINVFPALHGMESLHPEAVALDKAATRQWLAKIVTPLKLTSLNPAQEAAWTGTSFPGKYLSRRLDEVLYLFNADYHGWQLSDWLPTPQGFPGYRLAGPMSLQPVLLKKVYKTSPDVFPECQAEIVLTLSDSAGVLTQAVFPQTDLHHASVVIHWREEKGQGGTMARNDVGADVCNLNVYPVVTLSGQIIGDMLASRPYGAEITVSLSRRLRDGALETDHLTGRLQAGALTVLAISSGSMAADAAVLAAERFTDDTAVLTALAFQLRSRQDQALRLLAGAFSAATTANLQATLCSREAIFQRIEGQPVRIGGQTLVTAPLTRIDVGHWMLADDESPAVLRELTLAAMLTPILEADVTLAKTLSCDVLSPLEVLSGALQQSLPLWCGEAHAEPLLEYVSNLMSDAALGTFCLLDAPELPFSNPQALLARLPTGVWQSRLRHHGDSQTVYRSASVVPWPDEAKQARVRQDLAADIGADSATDAAQGSELSAAIAIYSILAACSREAEASLPAPKLDFHTIALLGDWRQRRMQASGWVELSTNAAVYGRNGDSCLINLRTGQADFWSVTILDAAGREITAMTGVEKDVQLAWDFKNRQGRDIADGVYRIQATTCKQGMITSAHVGIILDGVAPAVTASGEWKRVAAGDVLDVLFSVEDISTTVVSLRIAAPTGVVLLQEDAILKRPSAQDVKCRRVMLDKAVAGAYLVHLVARDEAGNSTSLEIPVAVTPPSQLPEAGPATVLVAIPGLSPEHRVIAGDVAVLATVNGLAECTELAIYLDDALLLKGETNTRAINGWLTVDGLAEGRHVLQARVKDKDEAEIRSENLEFYYSRFANDNISPEITLAAGGLPPRDVLDLVVSAWDNQAMHSLQVVTSDGTLIKESISIDNCQELVLGCLPVTLAQLTAGLVVTAIDANGNQSARTVRYPLPPVGNPPEVELIADLPAEPLTSFPVTVLVMAHSDMPLAGIAIHMNGVMFREMAFPEGGLMVIQLSEHDLLAGNNLLTAQAWDSAGRSSSVVSLTIRTAVFHDITCSPNPVRPWDGTASAITAAARLKSPQEWRVELLDEKGVVAASATGSGESIHAVFPIAGLTDGDYTVHFAIPALSATAARSVVIDAVRGNPKAEITSPSADAIVQEGVLKVLGSACTTESDPDVRYAIELWDDHGAKLGLTACEQQGDWLLTVAPASGAEQHGQENIVWREKAVEQDCLAVLDLSGVHNGRYRLRLTVHQGGQAVATELSFSLDSQLKTGQLAFSEEDLRVSCGAVGLLLKRYYSSALLRDSGHGYGWSTTLTAMDPVIDDERVSVTDVSDTRLSVRTGGSRDVTVTLADGRRVTFAFALEEGGAWSFCYYAVWRGPAGMSATLTPTVDNRLMTLPGLEPYWAAAGPQTPWENYDFPGFVLTDQDGVQYELTREYLGEADMLGDGRDGLGLSAGEYANIAAYGDLRLTGMRLPDGKRLAISANGVQSIGADDDAEELLKFETDAATGRRTAAVMTRPNQVRVSYNYDQLGNLLEVRRTVNDGQERLRRRYTYGLAAYPHHITAVHDGAGRLLAALTYDAAGRHVRTTGPDGASRDLLAQPTAGYAVLTDALGHETVFLHDNAGRVQAKIGPDGARTMYEYDDAGRETAVTNPLGHVTRQAYDSAGRLQSRTNALGQTTSYSYRSDGNCLAVLDPAGRTAEYDYDNAGRMTAIKTFTGMQLERVYDAAGRPVAMLGAGGEQVAAIDYGSHGQLEAITEAGGVRMDFDYDRNNRPHGMTMTYFHPEDGSVHELAAVWDYDDDGRLCQTADSLGHWRAFQYDASGKLGQVTNSSGAWQRLRRDAVGRVVERWNQDGDLERTVYDVAGRPTLHGSGLTLAPEDLEQPPAVLTFPIVTQFSYDRDGRQTAVATLADGIIECQALGNELYACHARSPGRETRRKQAMYDAGGQLIAEESATGLRTFYQRDAIGRIIELTMPGGGRWLRTYGPIGELLSLADPVGNTTRFEYDARGLLSARIAANGGRRDYVYDAQGRLLTVIDEVGNCRETQRDSQGQPLRHLLPPLDERDAPDAALAPSGSAEFVFQYHSSKILTGVLDPLGRLTRYRRDELGRPIGECLPDGQESQIFYADDGLRPSRRFDFAGNCTTYYYQNHERLRRRTHAGAGDSDNILREYICSYDSCGRPQQITRQDFDTGQSQTLAMTHDHLGRLLERRLDEEPPVSMEYDLDDRVTRLTTDMAECRYEYGENGLCAQVSVTITPGVDDDYRLEYDQRGLLARVDFPDGGCTAWEWDAQARPAAIRHLDKTGQVLYACETTADAAGRQTTALETRQLADGNHQERRRQWQYDAWGRLRREESDAPGAKQMCYVQDFYYDLAGNRLADYRQYADGEFLLRQRSFDVNDRLLTETSKTAEQTIQRDFVWDDNGSLTAVYHQGRQEPERQFIWDCENKLTAVIIVKHDEQGRKAGEQRIDYTYDAEGLLSSQVTTTIADDGSVSRQEIRFRSLGLTPDTVPQLLETVESRDGVIVDQRFCLWSGSLLAMYSSRLGRLRCLTDNAGNVRGFLGQGDVAAGSPADYDSWGQPLPTGVTPEPGLGFAGEWQDPTTGLVYLRSRFYWPEVGIFISRDQHPGDPEQPLSLHRYAYCRNDPVNYRDPTGCFGMILLQAAMMSGSGPAMLRFWRGGIEYLAGKFADPGMTLVFSAKPRGHDHATVIVHGLQHHAPGYADDFIGLLKERGVEHDYYQFVWSGCQLAQVLLPPNPIHHGIALASLTHCLATLPAKGYAKINVVSHSWGTVLSRDALNRQPVTLNSWVTMGSPLSADTTPRFPYQGWMNIFTRSDWIVHLAPFVYAIGYTNSATPLFMQTPPPLKIDLGGQANDAHGVYWYDPLSLARIAAMLKL
jgi:RHS repeat-associated protein